LLGVLRCDICEVPSVETAKAPSPPKPRTGTWPAGRNLGKGPQALIEAVTVTLCSQQKASHFSII
jgi:hypothetical protein